MDKKTKFNELLTRLVEIAMENNNVLDKETVDKHFSSLGLEEKDFNSIYEYLRTCHVSVVGVDDKRTADAPFDFAQNLNVSEEENMFVQMYYDELDKIEPLDEDTETNFLASYLTTGDSEAFKRLTENNLSTVVSLSKRFADKGVSMGDLIQEGNLGLIEGISTYVVTEVDRALLDFKEHIALCICNAMQNAIDEQIGSMRIGDHLADRANMLDDASRELAKELGREPDLAELAQYTSLPEDEVHNIMKYSLDALNKVN